MALGPDAVFDNPVDRTHYTPSGPVRGAGVGRRHERVRPWLGFSFWPRLCGCHPGSPLGSALPRKLVQWLSYAPTIGDAKDYALGMTVGMSARQPESDSDLDVRSVAWRVLLFLGVRG